MPFLRVPIHVRQSPLVAAPVDHHPLVDANRPLSWAAVVVIVVIVRRWSADQVTEVLGALVPVLALFRGARVGLSRA